MKGSTMFVLVAAGWAVVIVAIALWLKAATSEPRIELTVLDISAYQRGDLITNAEREVFVVKTIRAPHTLVCVRKD